MSLTRKLCDLIDGARGAEIASMFARIEEAERCILEYEVGHVPKIFLALQPFDLGQYHPSVYSAHIREICQRAKDGRAFAPLTRAEVLLVLMSGSLRAPLEQDHMALYERLCREITGVELPGTTAKERYPGAALELLAAYQRKSRPEREDLDKGRKFKRAKPENRDRALTLEREALIATG
jgi:hypothetical protein